MQKTLDKPTSIISKNERVIANILHDIKSPLYSIKVALQNQLNCELNRDIYDTVADIVKYIENFLVDYNFKTGKFNNKAKQCDIKEIINKKIEDYKYIFISKKIRINIVDEINKFYIVNSIEIFLSSIIGNIISNIAFHALEDSDAIIKLERKKDYIVIDFQNNYSNTNENFSMGLDFCKKLSRSINSNINFNKTNKSVSVCLKISDL